ncbi:hypothetical protein [Clostridium phage Amboise]|nr:hypothetical protein [Clostridium phage Amboise]DAH78955.1 MAG TPA: hypothetical protein [Caudoviricetes sp.]
MNTIPLSFHDCTSHVMYIWSHVTASPWRDWLRQMLQI